MRHLILGGGGFIGYHLANRLLKEDRVRVFDIDLKKYNYVSQTGLELVSGRFSDCDFNRILKNVDIVWHLISTTIAAEGTENLEDEFTQNVLPTIRLLEAMVKNRVPKIIFISSGGTVYGESGKTNQEESPLNPICSYGVQKLAIEKCISLYQRYHGLECVTARLSNPYGVLQGLNKKQGVIPIFMHKIKNNEPIEIWGDGDAVRDYIYISDAIDALLCLSGYHGMCSTFNVASGECISLNGLIQLIEKLVGQKAQICYRAKRQCDVLSSRLETDRIWRECGWKAEVRLEDGIRMLMQEEGV